MTQSDERRSPAELGLCQWFHYEARDDLHQAVTLLRELGVRHLRTGISWADYHRPGGARWVREQFEALREFELLVSVWHTPPSLSENGRCNAPPRRLRDYADFIDLVLQRHGDQIAALELWNEPNNRMKWDFVACDPQWRKFAEMVGAAAHWAQRGGMTTVLGGMIPVDVHWLALMQSYGALKNIDVVAIHAFPQMWWPGGRNWDWYEQWRSWEDKLSVLAPLLEGRPIWVTETGLATWEMDRQQVGREGLQQQMLLESAKAPAERIYWYSLCDLASHREAIEGFHVDENEYHMGLVTQSGRRKQAYAAMKRLQRQNAIKAEADERTGALRLDR